jgi:hypothetical protein
MKQTQLRAVTSEYEQTKEEQFAEYIARVVGHPKTPRMVKNLIDSVLIVDLSNNSGYDWTDDPEAVRFMLPRLLGHLNEMYSSGLMDVTFTVIKELLPKAVKDAADFGRTKQEKGGAS